MSEFKPNDVESVLTGRHEHGDTIAFSRVGVGVSVAFAGKVFPTTPGVCAIGSRSGGSSFDVTRAACRFGYLSVPKVLQDLVGAESAAGIELVLETGEQCVLWKMPQRTKP
jgi:hypothetical protein